MFEPKAQPKAKNPKSVPVIKKTKSGQKFVERRIGGGVLTKKKAPAKKK